MQFMEYQQWLLQKICAVYQISQAGARPDRRRQPLHGRGARHQQTDEKASSRCSRWIKDTIDLEVIGEHGQGLGDYLEFSGSSRARAPRRSTRSSSRCTTPAPPPAAEWRDAHGMDPDGDPKATHGKEGLRMHLPTGQRDEIRSALADVLKAENAGRPNQIRSALVRLQATLVARTMQLQSEVATDLSVPEQLAKAA
jgi:hypothetical protein